MTLREKLKAGKKTILLEVSPPKGVEVEPIVEGIMQIGEMVDAISVPENPRGRARMDPLAFGHILKEKTGKEVLLHITCRDKNIIALQSELLGAYALGIKNLLLLTGDPPSQGDYPSAKAVFDVTSEGLIALANKMRDGMDLSGREIGRKLDFFLGAGFNPFAEDPEREKERTKRKISLGVDFLVSQPIFSLERWNEFIAGMEGDVYFIGGVWVLKSLKIANFLRYEVPGIFVPNDIIERMENAKDERSEGMKIAEEIALALLEQGQAILLMTGNDLTLAKQLLEGIR